MLDLIGSPQLELICWSELALAEVTKLLLSSDIDLLSHTYFIFHGQRLEKDLL